MGGCDIYFSVDGKLSERDIEKLVQEKRTEDAKVNGHQEGYSGDWQTISDIKYTNKVFETVQEAHDWCSSNCPKWEGVAVHYKSYDKTPPSKKVESLEKKIEEIHSKFLKDKEALLKKIKSKPFVTCTHCKSRINTEYANNDCAVCGEPTPARKKTGDKFEAKLKELQDKIKTEKEAQRKKLKFTIKWLVYGVAAC